VRSKAYWFKLNLIWDERMNADRNQKLLKELSLKHFTDGLDSKTEYIVQIVKIVHMLRKQALELSS